jgi:hypothetical protein
LQVSWEFWTNSNDQCGPVCDVQKEFIKEFVPVAKVRSAFSVPKCMIQFVIEKVAPGVHQGVCARGQGRKLVPISAFRAVYVAADTC